MDRCDAYRHFAAKCVELARRMDAARDRLIMLEMALLWSRLAEYAAKTVAREERAELEWPASVDGARAMLDKAVAAVKADKTKALNEFTNGQGSFLDRDLYVFCANVTDGKLIANGNPNAKQLIGTDARVLKDSNGMAYGQAIFDAGQKPEGQVTEVTGYLFSKPSDPKPVPKNSFVARVGDIYCGVGYYKM